MLEKTLSTSSSVLFSLENYENISKMFLHKKRNKDNYTNELKRLKNNKIKPINEPCIDLSYEDFKSYFDKDKEDNKLVLDIFKVMTIYEKLLKKLKDEFSSNQGILNMALIYLNEITNTKSN